MAITASSIRRPPHWSTVSFSNHGFLDGNKRTALYLVELLVQRSGYVFDEDDEVVADTITSVAGGEIGYEELPHGFVNA